MVISNCSIAGAYQECLARIKSGAKVSQVKHESRELLNDYADVIAQKALVDARISLLQDNAKHAQPTSSAGQQTFVTSLIRNEDALALTCNLESSSSSSNPMLDAEYRFLYQQFTRDCEEKVLLSRQHSKEHLKSVSQSLVRLEEGLSALSDCLRDKFEEKASLTTSNNESLGQLTDWSSVALKCTQLNEQMLRLAEHVKGLSCKHCCQLHETIQKLKVINYLFQFKQNKIIYVCLFFFFSPRQNTTRSWRVCDDAKSGISRR